MHGTFFDFTDLAGTYLRILILAFIAVVAVALILTMNIQITNSTLVTRVADRIKDEADKSGYISQDNIETLAESGFSMKDNGANGALVTVMPSSDKYKMTATGTGNAVLNGTTLGKQGVILLTGSDGLVNYGTQLEFIVYKTMKTPSFFATMSRTSHWSVVTARRSTLNRGNIGLGTKSDGINGAPYGYERDPKR